ncbi:MAG: Nif3-like dinuclear metal center hexameric protein [Desulfobacteraceae bacterium]|nr:Nif3-like dinuclear metal center hexameric protein [Desulfobacteraceae bacterium]
MNPTLKDILALLEELAPLRLAEPWDNPGLQVGSYLQVIRKISLALDPTLRSLRAAHSHKAQLLLTHHPLVLKPLSSVDINGHPGEVIFGAIKGNVSVVSAHTNLDVAKGGINEILAGLLDLQDVEVLKETFGEDGVGLGRIGNLPEPVDLSAATETIRRIFGPESVNICGKADDRIHRVAVVGGSGGSLVPLAATKGADLLLTGDVSYHHALEAEYLGIILIDVGHFATEKTAFGVFGKNLREKFAAEGWEVDLEVDEGEADPLRRSG